jgi:hypothetical protein
MPDHRGMGYFYLDSSGTQDTPFVTVRFYTLFK